MRWSILFLLALPLTLATLATVPVQQEGAAPGAWTMDLDSALRLAGERNLPVLLNFTGSDWCYWCKLMDKNVFAQPEFTVLAQDQILLVTLDFPQNASLVPAPFRIRNNALLKQYRVGGFPTYILLKPDGRTELGRLSAGREKTPASFWAEIQAIAR